MLAGGAKSRAGLLRHPAIFGSATVRAPRDLDKPRDPALGTPVCMASARAASAPCGVRSADARRLCSPHRAGRPAAREQVVGGAGLAVSSDGRSPPKTAAGLMLTGSGLDQTIPGLCARRGTQAVNGGRL